MEDMPIQNHTTAQYRALRRLQWVKAIKANTTATSYPDANEQELQSIREQAALLAMMIRNAARMPPERTT